jgi:hypothetical protein
MSGSSQGTRDLDPGAFAASPFQDAMNIEILIFFERDMGRRQRYGFFPFLGHGGAIRADAWSQLGGFPLVVSEDYAFALRARQHGSWGVRIDDLRSFETYPDDFGSFVIRVSKFACGAAELIRRCLPGFVVSRASWIEKVDASMLVATYVLMPIYQFNILLSAYLCHQRWVSYRSLLSPRLPYVFLAMLLLSFPVAVSVTPSLLRASKYWFWAFAVYAAALPVASFEFVKSLFMKPTFRRTPKQRSQSPSFTRLRIPVGLGGLLEVFLSCYWWSPFAPILAASGVAQASFPLYLHLHEESSFRGRLGRILIYTPALLFITGVVTMWLWGTR